jgi:hypothetical protein
MRKNQHQIGSVTVLSAGEQIAYVTTPSGGYVVGSIPDARTTDAEEAGIIKRVNSYDEAVSWFDKQHGS